MTAEQRTDMKAWRAEIEQRMSKLFLDAPDWMDDVLDLRTQAGAYMDALEAENAKLRQALKPLADAYAADKQAEICGAHLGASTRFEVPAEWLKRAHELTAREVQDA